MKKTLLSVIAGLAVIGSANAGIKETCLEHPDKLVWVEKTQRCVPINPCLSDDKEIHDAYCVDWGLCAPGDTDEALKLWIGKWFGREIVELKHLDSKAVGVKTDDGQYFSYWCTTGQLDDECEGQIDDVAFAYTHTTAPGYYTSEDKKSIESGGYAVSKGIKYVHADDAIECDGIKNFAELLFKRQYNVKYEDNKCIFFCEN